jgi:hypothetical protein
LSAAPAGFAGDLLLLFSPEQAEPAGRAPGGWRTVAAEESWRLLVQSPSEDWKGAPFSASQESRWRIWLFGEMTTWPDAGPPTGSGVPPPGSGHYLLMAWDRQERRWHVWTDRFGTLHAYHCGSGGRAALGTFSPSVAAAASGRALDWSALSGFFAFGFFPGDRTHFEDVRILRPASHSTFDASGQRLSSERYWRWGHRPDARLREPEAVEELGRLLAEVMRDQTGEGRIALPISGGLDSRSTVAALAPGAWVWSYSYGYSSDSPETRIARQVARARGLSFDMFTIGEYLFDRLDQILESVEGFQDVTLCRQAAVVGEIAARADYVIAAHWGDVWLDDMGLIGRPRSPTEEEIVLHALATMEKRGREWLLGHLCAPRLSGEDPEAVVREFVREELALLAGVEDPDFRVKALKTDQWSFRWTTSSLRMYQPGAFPRLPFYDTRLADFFLGLSSERVAGRRLQIEYLKRFAPDLAGIEWQASGASLFARRSWRRSLPLRALRKAYRLATRRRAVERNWEAQFLSPAGRAALEDRLLPPGRRVHSLVSPQKVRSLLDEFFAEPTPARGYSVSMLLTFSAWLERWG